MKVQDVLLEYQFKKEIQRLREYIIGHIRDVLEGLSIDIMGEKDIDTIKSIQNKHKELIDIIVALNKNDKNVAEFDFESLNDYGIYLSKHDLFHHCETLSSEDVLRIVVTLLSNKNLLKQNDIVCAINNNVPITTKSFKKYLEREFNIKL